MTIWSSTARPYRWGLVGVARLCGLRHHVVLSDDAGRPTVVILARSTAEASAFFLQLAADLHAKTPAAAVPSRTPDARPPAWPTQQVHVLGKWPGGWE